MRLLSEARSLVVDAIARDAVVGPLRVPGDFFVELF